MARPEKYRKVGYEKVNGIEIVGLKKRPNGRYYAADNPAKTFGTDAQLAVQRFRVWQSENHSTGILPVRFNASISLADASEHIPELAFAQQWAQTIGQDVRDLLPGTIDDKGNLNLGSWDWVKLFSFFRDMLLNHKKELARFVGIPELSAWQPAGISAELSLATALERYLNKPSGLSKAEKRQVESAWRTFSNAVKVSRIAEIGREQVDNYSRLCWSKCNASEWSYGFIRRRVRKLQAVLRFNADKGNVSDHCLRVAALVGACIDRKAMLRKSAQLNGNGKSLPRVTPEQAEKILAATKDPISKAMILLGMNAGYYLGECITIPADAINTETGILDTYRHKTGVRRIAKLWKRTIDAIKAVGNSEGLLFTRNGKPCTYANEFSRYQTISKRAGCSDVWFKQFRRTVKTVCTDNGIVSEHIRTVLGQELAGIDQDYYDRSADAVARVSSVMESYYFGEGESKKEAK